MNRPRKKDECYRCYKKHLKEEEAELKEKLKWRNIWTSSIIVPDAKKKDLPEYLRPLVKLKVRGTFERGRDSMPNSMVDKQKKERVFKKLQKKGIVPNAT